MEYGTKLSVVTLVIDKAKVMVVHVKLLNYNVVDRNTLVCLFLPPAEAVCVNRAYILPVTVIDA